jgi:PAS domain S-box-containing protein
MSPEEDMPLGFSGLPPGELLRLGIDAAPAGIAMFDRQMRYVAVNRLYRDHLSLGDKPLLGRTHYDVFPEIPQRWRDIHSRCLAGATEDCDADPFVRANGTLEYYRWSIHPWHDHAGAVGGIVLFLENVTLRVAEQAERQQWADAFDNAAVGMAIGDPITNTIRCTNAAYAALRGMSVAEMQGSRIIDGYPPEEQARVQAFLSTADKTGRAEFNSFQRRKDGTTFPVEVHVTSVRDGDGAIRYRVASIFDITERQRIEAELRQSQKMEAIGKLTGGVAHDFNNLLTVVLGSLEMLIEERPHDAVAVNLARLAMQAADRGARLTAQLLAFARRQPLAPQRVDVNRLIADLVDMFDRTLGKEVELSTELAPDLWPVDVDRAQLEAALLNLATNARDAMQGGGRLVIRTFNGPCGSDAAVGAELPPGDHVVIETADAGTGMSDDILTRMFEPFFTTKEPGKGSGLGLSMVYGFVKQSGGHVSATSVAGAGTTVRILLPRAGDAAPRDHIRTAGPRQCGRGETVLAVEDDMAVRQVVAAQLARLGYRVLTADTAAAALTVLEREPVDVLLSDVVMPGGMNGRDLARLAHARWPRIGMLLVSGFPNVGLDQNDGRFRLLRKPYRNEDLAKALRQALDDVRMPD